MSLLSRLFGKKKKNTPIAREREDSPTVYDMESEDKDMTWAIEKANLTLPYFEECLANPKPGQDYLSIKVRFDDQGKTEHIWLTETSFDDDGNLFGVIGNDPIDVSTVKMGQRVGVDRNKISDWMIVQRGRLIGGYTIRAIRDNMPEDQLPKFDAGLGGIHVDQGEDYLPVNNQTPEGAILLLEQAYNEDNLEKAMACKDFRAEAIQMLPNGGEGLGEEVIKQTEELLLESFVQYMQAEGLPKIKDVIHAFPKREYITDDHIVVTETCVYPDGSGTVDKLNVYRRDGAWRVGAVVE